MSDDERDKLVRVCQKHMFVTLTADHVEAGRSGNGGWSREQFRLVGVDWPPAAGWKGRVIGRRFPGSDVAAFIRLRGVEAVGAPQPSLFDAG